MAPREDRERAMAAKSWGHGLVHSGGKMRGWRGAMGSGWSFGEFRREGEGLDSSDLSRASWRPWGSRRAPEAHWRGWAEPGEGCEAGGELGGARGGRIKPGQRGVRWHAWGYVPALR